MGGGADGLVRIVKYPSHVEREDATDMPLLCGWSERLNGACFFLLQQSVGGGLGRRRHAFNRLAASPAHFFFDMIQNESLVSFDQMSFYI